MKQPAIVIRELSKSFRLPHERYSGLKSLLVNFYRRQKGYENQKVLNNISLQIDQGEFFGIVGRNGSGKSTLLKLLAGIYAPDQGEVKLNGRLTPFIELGVGFNPELTGRENVYLNGALLGFDHREMDAMYDEIVTFAELEKFMDQKLKNYSSGMQVRLAFSIAIRAESEILLIDEVLAVGDQSFQEKCFRYFEEVKKTDKTVIFISHDAGAVERFCTRAAIVDRGKLVDVGAPRDMVLKYGAIVAEEAYETENANSGKRQGTGAVHIGATEILNTRGEPVKSLSYGEPFSIKTQFEVLEKLEEKVIIGIGIMDDQGNSIMGPNTEEVRKEAISLTKDGYFEAKFDQNPLSPGSYSITVGFFNERSTFTYELLEGAVKFKIVGQGRHGKIHIEPTWRIQQGQTSLELN